MHTVSVGDLTFTVKRSHRRATIAITVDRDGSLTVAAPSGCGDGVIERVIRSKLLWIHTKLATKEQMLHGPREKRFVNGAGFFYLGRSYRLLIIDAPADACIPPLRLYQRRFLLRRDAWPNAVNHFNAWYARHGRAWIQDRVERFAPRVDVPPHPVVVRDLGFRWGSCDRSALNFHWRTILMPPPMIEYIIVHELAHLVEPRHSPAFWRRVERTVPDYRARRHWIAQNGARF